MRRGIFPVKENPETVTSITLPLNAFTAGTDVTMAVIKTKMKFATALYRSGRNGIKIIPAIGIEKDKISKRTLSIIKNNLYFTFQCSSFHRNSSKKIYNSVF